MICTACSSENDARDAVCRTCENPLPAAHAAGNKAVVAGGGSSVEARIASVETRLAALTKQFVTSGATPAGTPTAPARRETAVAPSGGLEQPTPTIDVGTLRVTFGGPHGAQVDTATDAPVRVEPLRRAEQSPELPAFNVRPAALTSVWDAFAGGASIVQVAGVPGAGATTLLHFLAAAAQEHGFADGALLLTDVRGPARDIAQRLAALIAIEQPPRYRSATELMQMFAAVQALVLLDRATVTAECAAELRGLFPTLRFVIVQAPALLQTPTVALGPLPAEHALRLLEASCGRPMDGDNRRVALDIGATADSMPEPIRLIGVAARELRRSFISLRVQFDTAERIIGAMIASLSPADQRVLGALALARAPLPAHHLAYVVGSSEIRASLDRLAGCELIRSSSSNLYELPNSLVHLVSPLADADAIFARIVDVFCDAFDPLSTVPVLDRQSAAAEPLLETVAERCQWGLVLALGPRLAEIFAGGGMFGAWGRVLSTVDAAATQLDDVAALSLARHDLGVRALLIGERDKATTYLRSAARDRKRAGDEAGAALSNAVLTLADYQPAAATPPRAPREIERPASRQESRGADRTASPRATRPAERNGARKRLGPGMLMLLGLAIVAAALAAMWSLKRPSAMPAISRFSVDPPSVAAGSSAQLCVETANAAVVEIFPAATRLPGTGNQCITVRPAVTTRYIAVASAIDGAQIRDSVTVDVHEPAPARRVTIAAFSATPARIKAGQSTRLCYAVTGADVLRIVPRVGDLTRLRSCRTITLREPHAYVYRLSARGENGQIAVRQVRIDVVRSGAPVRTATRNLLDARATRQAIYQFDATPSMIARGQATSLCVGIDRPALGYVTHVGRLQSGVTRCYRVQPRRTTVYRLYLAMHKATAVRTVTVFVQQPGRRHDVAARNAHR